MQSTLTKLFCSLLLTLLVSASGHCQEDARASKKTHKGEFHGLLKLGLTGSKIYGDDFGGYNKLGFTAGVGTFTNISKVVKFQIEINYATRGSRKPPNPKTSDFTTFRIAPHYIDIPLLFKKEIGPFEFELGICNGIYLFHKESDEKGKIPSSLNTWQFNRYELAANAGINTAINEKWQFNARFHYSITPALGKRGIVRQFSYYGGAYSNVISLSLIRVLLPKH